MIEQIDFQSTTESGPLVFKTGGIFMFAGLWFLLLGLAMTAGLIWMAVFVPDGPPLWLRVLLLVFAAIPLAAAAFGLLLTFGGERITLDAGERQVRIAYGRWWTWKREVRSFEDFYAVEVHRQSTKVGAHDEGGQPTYPVRLLSGGDEVELTNISSYRNARAIAEKAADYLSLPLHEATESETVIREAGALDESLAQRAKRLGEDVQWPKLPRGSRIEVRHQNETTLLDLPRPNRKMIAEGVLSLGFLLIVYGGTLGGVAYFLGDWLDEFGFNSGENVWPAVIRSVTIIPVVYILFFGIVLLTTRERVAVSPRVFKRIWRFPIGTWTRKIPAGEIEELLSDSDDVILRTDRTSCRVGYALDKKERRWLREAIRFLLVKKSG